MLTDYHKDIIVADFEAGPLEGAKAEFKALLAELGGNEKIEDAAQYLFGGCERLKGNVRSNKELPGVVVEVFKDLTEEFKEYVGYNSGIGEEWDGQRYDGANDASEISDNLGLLVGQMVRYIDLMYCMRAFNQDGDFDKLLEHSDDIKRFIFSNRPDWMPSDRYADQLEWYREFKSITSLGRSKKQGFEPYLVTQLSESARKMFNKIKHRYSFPKRFKTEIPFYDDYFLILSLYVTAVLAFIELMEAWVNIKPYFEEHRGQLG